MKLILMLLLLTYGIYTVISYMIICPTISARQGIGMCIKEKEKSINKLLNPLTNLFIDYIPISEDKLDKLNITLKTVGIKKDAKRYICEIYSKSLFIALLGIPIYFFISPILSLICLAFGFLIYRREMKEPFEKLHKKREEIEKELSRFASTISNNLYTTKDVITMLSNYQQVASSKELANELFLTISDMKSGNPKNALQNFEGRIGSPKLSEITRGLMSVIDGEDQTTYFRTKSHEFNKEYIEIKKREIEDRPKKLRKANILTILTTILIIIYIFAVYGFNSGSKLL